jgi:hypothetical protein
MRACTAIMGNFLPHARVLTKSFQEHHPGSQMTVLVVDGGEDSEDEPFDVVGPWDLGLDGEEVRRILTLFEGALPAGALRGALLRHLLHADEEPIVFLDPDTQVFGSLDEVSQLAERHGVVLSPHLLHPPAHHHGFAGDRELLLAGAFNSGLVATGPSGAAFLDWWTARLQRWTLLAPAEGYYAVQRWLDLVPAMFPHHVLRDPGYNVMTLNASERALSEEGGRLLAGRQPLRLFHFGGGFDPKRPYLIAPGHAPPGALFSEHECLAKLHRRYAEALLESGWETRPSLPLPIELEPGVSLDAPMRATYREALLASEESGGREPPNPYESGAGAFMDWLRAPVDLRRNACTVSRYLHARWRDDNLSHEFPDLVGGDAPRYLAWARGPQGVASGIPSSLAQSTMVPQPTVPVSARGINLVSSDGGLPAFVGERLTQELRRSGERVIDIGYPRAAEARIQVTSEAAAAGVNDVTIICLSPGLIAAFDYDVGVLFRPGRLVIVAIVDSVWSSGELAVATQIADEVWCWDASTANDIGNACEVHPHVLPFPSGPATERQGGDGDLVCWADLGERGHSQAVTERVLDYIQGGPSAPGGLHVYLSDWRADPLAFETLWGLSEVHQHLTVHRAANWREALDRGDALLSLGFGIGPVEAEALSAGKEVIGDAQSRSRFTLADGGAFRAAAVDRLAVLRADPVTTR